uniref:uncharacterized protein n=1 Tax=Myxine glutinosa TaxID=7769 RepID=UPI00358EEAD8
MCIHHAIDRIEQGHKMFFRERKIVRLEYMFYSSDNLCDCLHSWLLQPVNATGDDVGQPCLSYEKKQDMYWVMATWDSGSWYRHARVRIFKSQPLFCRSMKYWPARRSLLGEYDLSPLYEGKLTPLASNETINLYNIIPSLLIGVSKVTNEPVFASVSFNTMLFYEPFMVGSSHRPDGAMSVPTARGQAMDRYQCFVAVHARGKTIFNSTFPNRPITPGEVRRGLLRCRCIRKNAPNNHSSIDLPLELSIHDELFPDCCSITACIRKVNGEVLLAFSEYSCLCPTESSTSGPSNFILKAQGSNAEVLFKLQQIAEISHKIVVTGLSVTLKLC